VLRRMTNDDNYLPVMADCQRAMGRPSAALELLAQADTKRLNTDQQVEAVLVASGARLELGQVDEAHRLLQAAINDGTGGKAGQARLRFAFASALETAGDTAGAREWFESAAGLDPNGDAAKHLAVLDGLPVPDDDEDDGSGEFVVAELADDEDDDDEDDEEDFDAEFDDDDIDDSEDDESDDDDSEDDESDDDEAEDDDVDD